MRSDVEIRTVRDDEAAAWMTALNWGFLRPRVEGAEDAAVRMSLGVEADRTLGAFDGEACVGTFRSMSREMTVPGGGVLPVCAVTNVTVVATHRRRGLLTRMMDLALADAVRRGEPLAVLVSAEYPIYGRYGFGPCTWIADWTVDLRAARLGPYRPPPRGRIDLVSPAEVRAFGPELYDRVRRLHPGALDRPPHWWKTQTGELAVPGIPYRDKFHAVYRGASGRVDGLLTYRVQEEWQSKRPDQQLSVEQAIAATPEAEAELWRYALSVDWVGTVASGHRPPDDVLPLLLGDPRAARLTTHADYTWLRVLDPPAALEARTYATAGPLVVRVRDAAGHAEGTYRLDASTEPGATRVRPTTEAPDITMDVGELGALYLGDESAVRLAALGRVLEDAPGSAARADALLRTSRRPWCPDPF